MGINEIGSGQAAGLMAFLDFMIEKGYAPGSSISPWKSATKQVLSTVEGDDFGAVDMRNFDIDEYLQRFENVSMGKYKADSLTAYRSRFRKAVESYRSYLADPNWKPTATTRRTGSVANTQHSPASKQTRGSQEAPRVAPEPVEAGPALIAYPFPLKSGQMAQLRLPTQLDRDDADRLTHFIRALVFEQHRQFESSEPDGETPKGTMKGGDADG